jgi:hypothetical protein
VQSSSTGRYVLRIPIGYVERGAGPMVVHAWDGVHGHASVVLARRGRNWGGKENDIVLAPGAVVCGRVEDADGRTLAGTTLAFRRVRDDGIPEIPFAVRTEPDGSFARTGLREGDEYEVLAPEWESVEPARLRAGAEGVTIRLRR